MRKWTPAPAQGQTTTDPSASQLLVNISGRGELIKLSPDVPTALDVRIRDRYVRYVSDPQPGARGGLWRTGGDGTPEKLSPLALLRISVGSSGRIEIELIHPRTGDYYPFEGTTDEIADQLHRAGARLGCRAERRRIFWALTEFIAWARRQAAARGAAE